MKRMLLFLAAVLSGCDLFETCPGMLSCEDKVCCEVGLPYACNGYCYSDPSPCQGSYLTCTAEGGGDQPAAQTWSLRLQQGQPIRAGFPPEIATITISPGVMASTFSQIGGQWYVLDRLNNVVDIQFGAEFVSNRWRFTGTGGPSPDGMTVHVDADGDADAGYPAFTTASGTVRLDFMQPGLPAVTQTADWHADRL